MDYFYFQKKIPFAYLSAITCKDDNLSNNTFMCDEHSTVFGNKSSAFNVITHK